MQVLLRKSTTRQDILCPACNQSFRVYWERTSPAERQTMRAIVEAELRHQHAADPTSSAHPEIPFNLPDWAGPPQFSGAALLGGLTGFHKAAPTRRQNR
jgi:hypothetical protein